MAVYAEDDLLPISALQHVVYCERRAFLVHVEAAWAENVHTAKGHVAHERVHEADGESRGDVRIARGVRLRSLELGLSGIADVIEFHRQPDPSKGIALSGVSGSWEPYPVEYKSGVLRDEPGYAIQLCGQALCIEEMLNSGVRAGALFYGKTRRRQEVPFDDDLRSQTVIASRRLRDVLIQATAPQPVNDARCEKCSLQDACLPKLCGGGKSAQRYVERTLMQQVTP